MEIQEFISKKVPMLGFGMMRLPTINEQENNIDIEETKKMVDFYMQNGMNYFDTAFMYHGGTSESAFRLAVSDRYKREEYIIADKLPIWEAKEKSDLEKIFNGQLKKANVEYFDFYLHHSLNAEHDKKSEEFGAYEFIQEMKRQGKIRYVGFSFHDTPEVLEEILKKRDKMEFVQLQINYIDWNGELRSREYYELARKYNLPIIVMEPLKGGSLANFPKDVEAILKEVNGENSIASLALKFCAEKEGVFTILSGMSNMEQLIDNVKTIKNIEKLTDKQHDAIAKAIEKFKEINSIPCTNCKYCIKCPVGIDIPKSFMIVNFFAMNGSFSRAKKELSEAQDDKKIDKCISCGLCESVCPQRINIIERLTELSEKFSIS